MTTLQWIQTVSALWLGVVAYFGGLWVIRNSTREYWKYTLRGAGYALAVVLTGIAIGMVLPK